MKNCRSRGASVEAIEKRIFLSVTAGLAAVKASPSQSSSIASNDLLRFPILQTGFDATPAASTSPSAAGGYSVPAIRGAYGVGQSIAGITYNVNFNGTQGDGTGQTIALVDAYNDPNIATDLATFDSAEGLPAPASFQVLNESGATSPLPTNSAKSGSSDWSGEESLDVEWAHSIAPAASIILFECNSASISDLLAGVASAGATSGVSVVSNSYGGGESSSDISYDSTYFRHAGVTYFASTGDSASALEYPAESSNVVAVGGTEPTIVNNALSAEVAWSSGGGGTSSIESQPIFQKGTIPAGTKRENPDVSLVAASTSNSVVVPICDSFDTSSSAPWYAVYGTSLSSPLFAAMVAISNQGRALEGLPALDTTAPASMNVSQQTLTRLYEMSPANFHDITSGNNGSHNAVAGYDEATGIGTPIANVLIPNLAGAGTVAGKIFVDNTGSGVYNSSDTPLANQTVYLDLNNDGKSDNSEPTTTTDAQGNYTFSDQPAGGVVRLGAASLSGYTLVSNAAPSISYGATDTANFVYDAVPSQLAITGQPPTSTVYGAKLSPIIVSVENAAGSTVGTDGSTVTLTLSSGTFSNSQTTATATAVNGVATFSNLQLSAAGTYTLSASDGSLAGTTSNSFAITKATPTVSWVAPSSITYGTALSTTQLNATANVPGTFAYTPGVGAVLSAGASDSLSVVFTPSDSTDYTSASSSTTITVIKATPTVSWSNPSSITYGTALSSTQLTATASTDGTFVYTPASGTVLGAGANQSLGVVFTPSDSTDYTTANASALITVTKATPTLAWSSPASITYGTALSNAQLNATASTDGTFVYTPASGTVLGAGANQSLGVVFTPSDSTDYTTANASAFITVTKATPTITWSNPGSIAYGTALSNLQLNATANTDGTFNYTPPVGTVLNPGEGQSLSTVFTPTDGTDYTTANASVSITVTGIVAQPVSLSGSTFYLELDSASPQNLDIWTNSSATGTPAYVKPFNSVSSLTLSSTTAGDSFTTDFSNGSVIPAGGLTFNGFGSAAANSLTIVGSGGADSVAVPGNGTVGFNSQSLSYSGVADGNIYFAPGGNGESLSLTNGTITLAPVSVPNAVATDAFSSISIAANATLIAPTAATHATRMLVETSSLSIAGHSGAWTGTLDLSNNDLDIANGSLADVNSQVAQGYTTGTAGIISSAAQNDSSSLTTLGALQNSINGLPTGAPLYGSGTALGTFDGTSPAGSDVLVKYTYYGDANITGTVDGSDYTRVDSGFLNQLSGWQSGDFNYDGVVNGSDYTLLDNAYNTQGATLAAQIANAAGKPSLPAFPAPSSSLFSQQLVASPQGWQQPSSVADTIFVSDADSLLKKSAHSDVAVVDGLTG